MKGWKREYYLDETGMSWPFPSTGLPTLSRPSPTRAWSFSKGPTFRRGAARRSRSSSSGTVHRCLPLCRRTGRDRFAGSDPAALGFKPTVNKFGGRVCGGVKVNVTNRDFQAAANRLGHPGADRPQLPGRPRWTPPPYEYEFEKPPVDMITGSDACA